MQHASILTSTDAQVGGFFSQKTLSHIELKCIFLSV